MTLKFLAAAVLTGAIAMPAFADDHHDWYRDNVIVVHDNGREFRIDRRDRLYDRVTGSPFRFELGRTYDYTDHCRRDQCEVLVYGDHSHRPMGRLWAPHIYRY
jgi:hypothetical protein